MEIRIVESADDISDWDNYVGLHPGASPYHRYAWQLSVTSAYDHPCLPLMAVDGDAVVGILPVVIMRMPIIRDRATSLPYCDLGGVLANDDLIAEELLQRALSACAKEGVGGFEIRQPAGPTCLPENELVGQKVRMLLPLPGSSEQLSTSFKSKLRSQINKSKKNGLTAELGFGEPSTELLEQFYEVYSINMHALGSPVHDREWFRSIARNFGKDCIIGIVHHEQQPVGGGIVLRNACNASIPWASTIAEFNPLAPNMLLYWTLLEYCADNGVTEFDFGRSTYGEGTYRFKSQWGAKPQLLCWQQYFEGKKLDPQHSKAGKIGLRSQIESCWRMLPLPVTTWAGPKIRKYISL